MGAVGDRARPLLCTCCRLRLLIYVPVRPPAGPGKCVFYALHGRTLYLYLPAQEQEPRRARANKVPTAFLVALGRFVIHDTSTSIRSVILDYICNCRLRVGTTTLDLAPDPCSNAHPRQPTPRRPPETDARRLHARGGVRAALVALVERLKLYN